MNVPIYNIYDLLISAPSGENDDVDKTAVGSRKRRPLSLCCKIRGGSQVLVALN